MSKVSLIRNGEELAWTDDFHRREDSSIVCFPRLYLSRSVGVALIFGTSWPVALKGARLSTTGELFVISTVGRFLLYQNGTPGVTKVGGVVSEDMALEYAPLDKIGDVLEYVAEVTRC